MTYATKTILVVSILAVGLAGGTTLVALAADPCVQPHWDLGQYGFLIDPNRVVGHPIAPILAEGGVPIVAARAICDPDGDPIGPIEVLYPPAGVAARIVDRETYEVRIAAPVVGISYIVLRAWDAPDPNVTDPNFVVVTIPVSTSRRPNSPPVLY